MTTFASLPLHPSLTRALDARGYQTATPVQAAVLDARCDGRDLLVSSQTGSGKTLAFGALMTQTLLGEAAVSARPRGARPLALAIVPTRELATQVREELGWLLKDTRLRLSSFTGGTGVVGDLRALSQGVDVVIGTPGRLVDLLRRERLDLTELKVVVLDEADEMLDLGFREDLETLLQAAPVERRTIMLSATLPHEIRAMARKFQRDALPVDPRVGEGGAGSAPSAAHQDIAYVAHTVAPGEKLATLINVLRAYDLESAEAARAIVFGTTREGVADLHAALLARGFAATAISGDRAQAERDRALDQIRRGEARILCATNVAARGIHLPEVDLIVHADLPLNAESLTHRSGRTGRAGRKGTAVLIVGAHERRKAERLLGAIKAQATWKPAPSVESIAAAARARLVTELLAEPQDAAGEPSAADVEAVVLQLESQRSAREALAQLVARELGRLPKGDPLTVVRSSPGGRDERESPRRSQADFASAGVTFRVNLGARDKADPRWMLPLICRRGGVTRREVGAIRIGPRETTFEIAGDAARDFGVASALQDPRAPNVRIERIDGGGGGGGGGGFEQVGPRPSRPASHTARPAPHAARPARTTASAGPRPAAPEPRPPELPAAAAPVAASVEAPAARPPASTERPAPPPARPASNGARPTPGPRPSGHHARPAPHVERRPAGPRPPMFNARPAPHAERRAPGPRPPNHTARPAPHAARPAHGSRPPGHTARPAPHGSRAHGSRPSAPARPKPKRK